jgi:hypothetical protein
MLPLLYNELVSKHYHHANTIDANEFSVKGVSLQQNRNEIICRKTEEQ